MEEEGAKIGSLQGGSDQMRKGGVGECIECGGTMKVTRENHRYLESGLKNVILSDIEVGRCSDCGRVEVSIPRLADLHEGLARVISRKATRLAPEEIRFLRKHLGWSGVDFANAIGVAPETVSRWETGKAEINSTAERLLRVLTWNQKPVEQYPVEELEKIDHERSSVARLTMAHEHREWALTS